MSAPLRSLHPGFSGRIRLGGPAAAVAILIAGCGGAAEPADPAAMWDPCGLPAGLLTEAGFAPGSIRRDVATEPGWAGCGWSSERAALRVLFSADGSPDEVAGDGDTRTEVTVANRIGRLLHTGTSDTATTCTVALPTAGGGVVRVRVDSAPGAAENACTRAERAASTLAPAFPV
ncbi:DUF3558 family protein [Nocardia fusca]|uniref:DUF3558 family protein n=1 Tax=Nocardia fusca TaxID=941183 RepID=UPI0007A741F9|nr:DUF3558 family protein [Nocardia fusca]